MQTWTRRYYRCKIFGEDKKMSIDIVSEFIKKLNEPDPPNGLLLLGINSAAEWLKSLGLDDKKIIYEYMKHQLEQHGDLPIKEMIIKILQQVGGDNSLVLLNMIIIDGETIHGKYLVSDAISAKSKITSV
jgi:hypothetical protein